jgi:hypothetical protein
MIGATSWVQAYGPAILASGLDLLETVISQSDGERDPRCLLAAFQAIHAVVDLYKAGKPEARLPSSLSPL